GARVAVVELDETTIVPRTAPASSFSRVEVELEGASGEATDIDAFVAAMASACHLRPATTSKFVAGLAAAGLEPEAALDFGPTTHQVAPGVPLDAQAFAYAWLRVHWAAFLRHDPGTRLAEDIEPLHQMRVSTRRLRATIALFADLLPPVLSHLRDELRWVGHELGAVRDLDVQIEALERLRANAAWEDASALAPLVAVVEADRRAERERLLALLRSARYDVLVSDMSAALRAGPAADREQVDVFAYATPILERRLGRLQSDGRRLLGASPAAEYHALRIVAKRFRYSLELFGELYGKPAERMTAAVRALQDLLGEHQDAEVATQRLRALVSRHRDLPPETLVAIGELRERYRTQELTYREQFPRVFRDVRAAGRPLRRAIASRRTRSTAPELAAPEEALPSVAEIPVDPVPPPPPPSGSRGDAPMAAPPRVEDGTPLSRMRQLIHRD
ncbi:MAG: CHAD domain-containing protein, partial [Dehalococcoidia bacterium]